MHEPLLGPRIKLERAKHHFIELQRIERQFFDQNPCKVVFDHDSKPGFKLAKVILDNNPPEIIHVLSGEIIYQLRSALDQIAVACAKLSKGPTKLKNVYFPTGDSPKGFKASCASYDRTRDRVKLTGNLRYFDSDLRKAIMRTRPYNGGNENLRAVFLMANIDKHLELIAVGASGSLRGISDAVFYNGGAIMGGVGDLKKGVTFGKFALDGHFLVNDPKQSLKIAGQIILSQAGPYVGRKLLEFLAEMINATWRVYIDLCDTLIARGDMIPQPPAKADEGWGFRYTIRPVG